MEIRKATPADSMALANLASRMWDHAPEELEPEFKGLKALWNECCGYVHPSDSSLKLAEAEHNLRLLSGIDESKQKPDILENLQAYIFLTTEAQTKEAEKDSKNMFHLNLLLIKVANKQIALQKAIVWTNEKNRRFYKKVLADKVRRITIENANCNAATTL